VAPDGRSCRAVLTVRSGRVQHGFKITAPHTLQRRLTIETNIRVHKECQLHPFVMVSEHLQNALQTADHTTLAELAGGIVKAVAPDADREERAGLPALVYSLPGNPQNLGNFSVGMSFPNEKPEYRPPGTRSSRAKSPCAARWRRSPLSFGPCRQESVSRSQGHPSRAADE
jgi:hypothetical protein